MSRLVIISAAHKPYRGALMERSAKRVGIEVVRFCEDQPWPNDFRVGKLIDGLECVKSLPQDVTHVMFLDSTDTLVLAGAEEIVAKFEERWKFRKFMMLLCGEKNCYPRKDLEPQYPPARTPWHFLNSGGWIMRRSECRIFMEVAAEQTSYCDQLCWTLAYLDARKLPFVVDEECRVFQSMYLQEPGELTLQNGRVTNQVTGEQPCVLHWNGTRNAGILPRAGVWACLNIESRKERRLAVA